ncbi:hypothetical protein [Natrialba aegyptia]|uniref:Uncharacterized protein n=1 Tax=Natrialba aegyptia DSM 13077 TaxID=1227491 RepID=M0AM29_9EURY|nr:hypothetical protein [Natrialba aegyptia]ELY99584.1 hypothetical protein C480_19974 [Natrialba aegyptia DSM 13077]
MLEQIDPRGKHFTIDGEDIVDEAATDRCSQTKSFEHLSKQEFCKLGHATAVAGPVDVHLAIEVFER